MDNPQNYGTETMIQPPAPASAAATSFFSPMNLLRVVLRRWGIVAVLILLGGIGAYIQSLREVKIYKAEAQLEMNVRRPKVINNEAVFEDSGAQNEDVIFNTRFMKFKSPAMERLATQEYFKRYPEDEASKGGPVSRYALAALIRDVHWYKDSSANVVYVNYYNESPEFAAKLVNVLSHCAGLLMMQENQAVSDEAVKWLITQLDDQREELEEVERQLANIRDELQMGSLEQRMVAVGQALVSVSSEREQLVSTLASRTTVLKFVKDLQGTDPNLEVLPTGLPKEEQLDNLIETWRNAHEELKMAERRFTDIHPEYKAAADKEARSKRRLEQFIELSAKAVENEIALLGQQLKQVDLRIAKLEREALELDQQVLGGNQRLQRLERTRDAADNAYQSMLRRMEEARMSADENMAFTKIIRNAEVPRSSVNSSRERTLIAGLFVGGMIGAVIAVLLSLLLDKIESVTDLKELGLHILGTIPTYRKSDSRSELATIGLRDKFCQMIEVFAGINALISSDKFAENTKVLLINSAIPGEGKSVSSCNLAISSAMNGSKTLLIDGDLRRPQLASVFSISEDHPSLLQWLVDRGHQLSFNELVTSDVIENMDLITSQPLKDINPAELLGRGHLTELIDWARERYDRIIIDTPPLGVVGDAQVLANLSDTVIIVSRIGKTRRRALKFVLAKFKEIDTPILGCIANDVPHSLSGMFKGGEGYGYGHSYKTYVSQG